MLIALIRILLIWWIATILVRWVGRLRSYKQVRNDLKKKKSDSLSDIPFSGEIEDADFEEIDER